MKTNYLRADKAETALQSIPSNSIDLIVMSPPYDQIRTYNSFSLDLHKIGKENFRVLKEGGIMCMVIQDSTKDFGKSCTTYRTILDYVDNIGFKLFENVIYSRAGRPGAWWSTRFRVDHEYILIFLKGKRPRYFNKKPLYVPAKYKNETFHGTQRKTNGELISIKKKKMANTKCRGTIWKYSASTTERNKIKLQHPATFPDKLAKDLIICFSDIDDVILDPMCGSGTTCVVAAQLDRRYIGIDSSKEYINIAAQRIKHETS